MKEHGLIVATSGVQAILEGRKTQTRRVIKPQLEAYKDGYPDGYDAPPHCMVKYKGKWIGDGDFINDYCPYGQVGDRLWVKETYISYGSRVIYVADQSKQFLAKALYKKQSPLFMSRKDSRITLEITGVRVERLQEITWQDCKKEGVEPEIGSIYCETWREAFEKLWDSLNAKRGYGWETNCWVWVINFRRVL